MNPNKSPKVSPRALMPPPPAHFFVQPGTPFDIQLFWQKYLETIAKYAPLLTQNPTSNVPPTNPVKIKNKPGRPKKASLEESDIELDEESTRKRSRSNSVSNQSRNYLKNREVTDDLDQMNATEIERLKNKLLQVEKAYSMETVRLKNRLLIVELANASMNEEVKTAGSVTSKENGHKTRWVDVVSKSIKKANNPDPKMHVQQIEVVNSILYEEREREKRKNNILIFGLSNQDEDQNGQGVTEKITNILNSIGINSNKIKKRFRPSEDLGQVKDRLHLRSSSK